MDPDSVQGSKLQPDINSKTLNSQFGWLRCSSAGTQIFLQETTALVGVTARGMSLRQIWEFWCVTRLCHTKRPLLRSVSHSRGCWNTTVPRRNIVFLLSTSFRIHPSIPRPNLPNQAGQWALKNYFLHKRGSVPLCRQWGITPPRHTCTFSPFLSLFLPLWNPPYYPGNGAKKIWTKSPEQLVSVRGPCQNTNTNLLLLFSRCVCMAGKDSRQVFQYGSFRAQMNTSYEPFDLCNPTSQQQLGLKASTRGSFTSLFLTT